MVVDVFVGWLVGVGLVVVFGQCADGGFPVALFRPGKSATGWLGFGIEV